MKLLGKIVEGIVSAIRMLTAVAIILAVVLNFANIIARYIFSSPIASAEEVMLFLLVGIVFLGNSVVGWEGSQLRMDIVLHALPASMKTWLDIVADLAVIAMSGILIVLSWPVIGMLAEFDQRSQVADIPLVIPQALIPIGLGLMVILVTARLLLGRKPRDDVFAEQHPADVT